MKWISTTRASSGWTSATWKIRSSPSSGARRIPTDFLLFCCNFTPVAREKYEFGVPEEGFYEEC